MAVYRYALGVVPGCNYEQVEKLESIEDLRPDPQYRYRLDRAAEGFRNGEFYHLLTTGEIPLRYGNEVVATLADVGRKYLIEQLVDCPRAHLRLHAAPWGNFSADEIWQASTHIKLELESISSRGVLSQDPLAFISYWRHYRRSIPTFRHYKLPKPGFVDSGEPSKDSLRERRDEFKYYLMALWDPTHKGRILRPRVEPIIQARIARVQQWFDQAYQPG